MDIRNEKSEIRNKMANIRSRIPASERKQQSMAACRWAEQEVIDPLRVSRGGRLTIFSYLSFRDEPITQDLLRRCLERGDRVLVPKIVSNEAMTLHEMGGEEDLIHSSWGIPEPADFTSIWPIDRYHEIDLVIVPGLAFDLQGGRIGFGAGYYDRFVEQLNTYSDHHRYTWMASLAFKESIVSHIPMEDHDFRLDMLFTESGTLYMKESSERRLWNQIKNRES